MCLLWNVLALLFVLSRPPTFAHQPYEESAGKISRTSTKSSRHYRASSERSHEVEQKCNAISSGSSDSARGSSSSSTQDKSLLRWAKNELSFPNGEWEQAPGSSPLLPFDPRPDRYSWLSNVSTDAATDDAVINRRYDPIHFVSFSIKDMNQKRDGLQEALQVSGVLKLTISTYPGGSYVERDSTENFLFNPGSSVLVILLEGFYTESEAGTSLCMLGCTLLPHRSSNVSNPWSDLPVYSMQSPPTNRTCNLMLQLHYPKEMSLTSRAIRGILKSLSNPGESSYFDPISVVSQMGADRNYQFRAGALVEAACKGSTPTVEDTEIYRGDHFCETIRESLDGQLLEPLFNWKCNKSEEYCTKLGPFKSKGGLPVPIKGSKIFILDVRCIYPEDVLSGKAANISAVFRAIPPSQNQYLVDWHKGLDGLTLVAEGLWTKSSGKLCMIACADGSQEDCKIKICLHIPTALSITQRSLFVGTISSLDNNDAVSFYPLSFYQPLTSDIRPRIQIMHYKYTKINNVGANKKGEAPLRESEKIRLSLLKYPSNDRHGALSRDLTVYLPIVSEKKFHSRRYLYLEIIAIEEFVVYDWIYVSDIYTQEGQQAGNVVGPQKEVKIVKVAAELYVSHPGIPETRDPVIHGEGFYNPRTGEMYLAGCREVSVAWQVLQNNKFDLVDGLDCNVEVVVRFPPKNAASLVDPTVNVTITSRRTEDDPFFYPQVSLQTTPTFYQQERTARVFRRNLKDALRLLTLSLMPMCIASQLVYIRKKKDSAPFISLVMLGVQAMGYGVLLIAGDEAPFAKLDFDRYKDRLSKLGESEWTQEIIFLGKFLILVAFLLNLYLCQKVVQARIQLRTLHPPEHGRVPSERIVLLIFLLIHAIGFLLVLTIHSLHLRPKRIIRHVERQGSVKKELNWVKGLLMEYEGLMHDLFLLPQVLCGAIWDMEGKPLRRVYYIGLTISSMLPHAFDILIEFLYNTYFAYNYVYANPTLDFYSWGRDVEILLLALVFAITIYVQQRWKITRIGSNKMMQYGSTINGRLPSYGVELNMPNISPSNSHEDSENGNGRLQESTS